MPQHSLSIRHRHAVPAAKLHPAQVERPASNADAGGARRSEVHSSVETILRRVGRRRRGGRRGRSGHIVQPAGAKRHADLG